MSNPKVFVSYAHLDEPDPPGRDDVRWLSYVKRHLGALNKIAKIEFWADTDLLGSQDWEARIFSAIDGCDIFILLVSPNSLSSEFITRKEVPRILKRQRRGNSTEWPALYPILLTPCAALDRIDWLNTPNMRPKDRKALSDFECTAGKDYRNNVMAGIVDDLVKLAESIAAPPEPRPDAESDPKTPPPEPITLAPGMPAVSGSYYLTLARQSQGATGLDPVLREVLLCLTFTGRSRVTTPKGTLVFSIRQALLHTSIAGGRIAATGRAFPEGWFGLRAQVTRIGNASINETLHIKCDDGLFGEVLAARGEAGHVRLFDIEPGDDSLVISGEVQVTYDAVHVDIDGSDISQKRKGKAMKAGGRRQIEGELAKLILEECGLTRLPLESCTG